MVEDKIIVVGGEGKGTGGIKTVNIDVNADPDYLCDGKEMPFDSNCTKEVFFERFPATDIVGEQGLRFFNEAYRVLRKGGEIHVVTGNLYGVADVEKNLKKAGFGSINIMLVSGYALDFLHDNDLSDELTGFITEGATEGTIVRVKDIGFRYVDESRCSLKDGINVHKFNADNVCTICNRSYGVIRDSHKFAWFTGKTMYGNSGLFFSAVK